jgi:uncharacterized protein YjbI with pentapeptide repeats
VTRPPHPPRVAPRLESAQLPLHAFDDWAVRDSLCFDGADLSGSAEAEHVELLRCRYLRSNLQGVRLGHTTVGDTAFELCDLSNLQLRDSTLRRVSISGSRTTGLSLVSCSVRDATFFDCRGPLSSFRFSTLRDVVFVGCTLSGADFQHSRLVNVRFEGCELDGAQFSSVTVTSARFAGCDLTGIGGVTSLTGATVTEADLPGLARVLATALGITVESPSHPLRAFDAEQGQPLS